MRLTEFLWPEMIVPALTGWNKAQVLAELALHLTQNQFGLNAEKLTQALMDREALASTALGEGIAVPHCRFEAAARLFICVGRSQAGVPFDSPDGLPTHLFFLLVAPESMRGVHLQALGRISRLCKDPAFLPRIRQASAATEIFQVMEEVDARC